MGDGMHLNRDAILSLLADPTWSQYREIVADHLLKHRGCAFSDVAFDQETALALAKLHRPNYVIEEIGDGTGSGAMVRRTRVKCDGDDCDFYAEGPRWFDVMDEHDAHLAAVLVAADSRESEAEVAARAWDLGVQAALDHAVRNEDGITLSLDAPNPYRPPLF